MKVAIVHEWFDAYAGSERVVEQLLACYPQADLYALVDVMPAAERGFLGGRTVRTSFIQRLPFARRHFRMYLGLMPIAVEQFDLSGYDLVISSSHAVAKGVITGPGQVHVSYVHSPMRYAWDLQAQYLREAGIEHGLRSAYARWLLHRLRMWDVRTAPGVDVFLANSSHVAERIRRVYGRTALVVPPPVDTEAFTPGAHRGSYYLTVARFVPYKRVALIVQAFARMPERRLIVVGDGPGRVEVARAAVGCANIKIQAPVGRDELISLMQDAKAFVYSAEEDFGITMAEAQACGTPVIAYGVGGASDIVDAAGPEPTGVLFAEQTEAAICDAIARFEQGRINAQACRRNALRFTEAAFAERFRAIAQRVRARDAANTASFASAITEVAA